MKKIHLFLVAFASFIFVFSCSKSGPKPKPRVPHLISVLQDRGSDSIHTSYIYDASGRITRIDGVGANGSPMTSYFITYSNGRIMITDGMASAGNSFNDTIILALDAQSHVIKRINIHNVAQSAVSPVSQSFTYDTIDYQLNSQGLRIGGTRLNHDSTWSNPGVPQSHVSTRTGTMTYTYSNSNLVQWQEN